MAQATIGDSDFDRDTAVHRRGAGQYDAELSARWTVFDVVNGGYLLALLGRALADSLPHPDPFTLTAHYLSAARPGPARIATSTVRVGRTLATGQASLFQRREDGSGVERVRLLATYGDLGDLPDDGPGAAKPPALPPYERCVGAADAPAGRTPMIDASGVTERLDIRLDPATCGWALGTPSGQGAMRGWMRLADGRDADPLALLLAVDTLPPTAFELGLHGWVPTVELTVHVRRRPAAGPLRVAVTTRHATGGFLEEDAEVWDTEDRLVAQSRQLARMPATEAH